MKTSKRVILSAILVAPLLFASSVAAVDGSTSTDSSTTTAQSTNDQNKTTTTQTSNDDTALQERLTERKNDLKIKLTNSEQQHIELKCKGAQGLISPLKGRINGIETSHTNVYKELVDRLTKLSDQLKARDADTTQLQKEIDSLKSQIDTFNTDLAAYKQAVSDLSAMDCAKDPAGFKASLLAARTAHDKVNTDAVNIKKYVNDTIKPTLQQIRSQLASDDTAKKEGQ